MGKLGNVYKVPLRIMSTELETKAKAFRYRFYHSIFCLLPFYFDRPIA
jgi:hypothetical protein